MTPDLLTRRQTHFVLWRPANPVPAPRLVLGEFEPGNPPTLAHQRDFPLVQDATFPDLWALPAAACGLTDGRVYHYWFEVTDTDPERQPGNRVQIADPFAFTVDWRLTALPPTLPHPPYDGDDDRPASVIGFRNGKLVPCDPGGDVPDFSADPGPEHLPANNRLVLYEMPTAWSKVGTGGTVEAAAGSFRDVTALVDPNAAGANFSDLDVVRPGRSYLRDLGVNALELLPPADSLFRRTWGYATSNYLAPDHELGFPEGNDSPTANADLAALVVACHTAGIRVFVDAVLAFGRVVSYKTAAFDEFHIRKPGDHPDDPDAHTSGRAGGHREIRNPWGSTLFRYAVHVKDAYDPMTGTKADLVPARQFQKVNLFRWMRDFRIDGYRLDSIESVANWDFVKEFRDQARQAFADRWAAAGLGDGADERFLVVGEELQLPLALLTQGRLDGLWNERFKEFVRAAVLGRNHKSEPSFEWTVRKMMDCRQFGFTDLSQAVIYLTSHDVGGFANERLFNFLNNNGVWDTKKRIVLAFACLLTAVGVPMILAGDEFADRHDLLDAKGNVPDGDKQVDPVNYSRATDDWRAEVLTHVSRLVKLRTTSDALAVNDIEFLHVDFTPGRRVLVWRRGRADGPRPVVVVANFSDYVSPGAEYVVPHWPATPPGASWREVTRDRPVPAAWVGREPLFAWEAKVYTVV